MASSSQQSLQSAISAVERAIARLDAAADIAAEDRAESAAKREAAQAEIAQSWQEHSAAIESELSAVAAERARLKEDNQRLSGKLSDVEKDYETLQQEAGATVARLDATVKQLDLILEH